MGNQENDHLNVFSNLMRDRRVRPTVLLPLWNIAGYALGKYSDLYVFVSMCITHHSDTTCIIIHLCIIHMPRTQNGVLHVIIT